jgi:hypothetical protein
MTYIFFFHPHFNKIKRRGNFHDFYLYFYILKLYCPLSINLRSSEMFNSLYPIDHSLLWHEFSSKTSVKFDKMIQQRTEHSSLLRLFRLTNWPIRAPPFNFCLHLSSSLSQLVLKQPCKYERESMSRVEEEWIYSPSRAKSLCFVQRLFVFAIKST